MASMITALALALQISAPVGPFIDADALRSDLKVLRQSLTTIHAGLYRYQSPAQLEAGFRQLERRFAKGATQGEVFLALSEFTAKIRCGHTFPSFWNQPSQTQLNLFMGRDKIPVAFRWMEGAMVVTRNDSPSPDLTPGTLITEVNGVPTQRILDRLIKLVKGDGRNDAKRIAELEIQDRKEWEAFDIYYALAYRPSATFQLKLAALDGSVKTIQVPAIDQKARLANRTANLPKVEKDTIEWQLSYPQAKTAVLRMRSWVMYNSNLNWQGYLRKTFTELRERGVENLILDIRGNGGGDSCGDEILRYLVPQKTAFPSGRTFIRYQKIPDSLALYISTWDRSFYDWTKEAGQGQRVPELNSMAYPIRGEGSVNAERAMSILPQEPRFTGRVFVLVDAECSSATFQFAQQVRALSLATIVGQPTGGNRRGINGGAIFFTIMPNSRIEIDLPIIAYLPSQPQPDAGLEPDITVADSRQDIAAGRDAVMDRVLREAGGAGGTQSASRP